jgi:hypothetical protein
VVKLPIEASSFYRCNIYADRVTFWWRPAYEEIHSNPFLGMVVDRFGVMWMILTVQDE